MLQCSIDVCILSKRHMLNETYSFSEHLHISQISSLTQEMNELNILMIFYLIKESFNNYFLIVSVEIVQEV